jgi:hypothetical protein
MVDDMTIRKLLGAKLQAAYIRAINGSVARSIARPGDRGRYPPLSTQPRIQQPWRPQWNATMTVLRFKVTVTRAGGTIDIALPGGVSVWMDSQIDSEALRRVLAAVSDEARQARDYGKL